MARYGMKGMLLIIGGASAAAALEVAGNMHHKHFYKTLDHARITQAIHDAELGTSGEIRVFIAKGDPKAHAMKTRLWATSEALVPARHAFDFNQALMDFGALVCTAVGGIAAVLLHFPPGARLTLPTFGIAFLPGLALATLLSGMGRRGG